MSKDILKIFFAKADLKEKTTLEVSRFASKVLNQIRKQQAKEYFIEFGIIKFWMVLVTFVFNLMSFSSKSKIHTGDVHH
jgi:uncharacterized membrane protein